MRCAIATCNLNNTRNSKDYDANVKFFRFPKDNILCKKWVQVCSRKDEINVSTARICSVHFGNENYARDFQAELCNVTSYKSKKSLMPNAIPCYNLPNQIKTSESENKRNNLKLKLAAELVNRVLDTSDSGNGVGVSAAEVELPSRRDFGTNTETNYEVTINELKEENEKLKNTIEALTRIFTDAEIKKLQNPNKRISWTIEDMSKATGIYSAGARSYRMLLKRGYPFPAISTLQKWGQKVELKPRILKQTMSSILHNIKIPFNKATFGMGCFWANDCLFGATQGILRTRVGYSGGSTPNPTYKSIGDHTEVIEVDYDPNILKFEDLLELFWNNHEYGLSTKIKKQYASLILYHDEDQKRISEASMKSEAEKRKEQLTTVIQLAGTFYPAEDYHQKYRLQQHSILCEAIGLNASLLQTSHIAARLNGYVAGVGKPEDLLKDLTDSGLPSKMIQYVQEVYQQHKGSGLYC